MSFVITRNLRRADITVHEDVADLPTPTTSENGAALPPRGDAQYFLEVYLQPTSGTPTITAPLRLFVFKNDAWFTREPPLATDEIDLSDGFGVKLEARILVDPAWTRVAFDADDVDDGNLSALIALRSE